jgi:hypothetical protein
MRSSKRGRGAAAPGKERQVPVVSVGPAKQRGWLKEDTGQQLPAGDTPIHMLLYTVIINTPLLHVHARYRIKKIR